MPVLSKVKGNLLNLFSEKEFDGIAHGCNCFHLMGAGIALQIAQQFPEAYRADVSDHQKGDRSVLGRFSVGYVKDVGFIANLYTQYKPGRVPLKKQLYSNIHSAFKELNDYAPMMTKLGIPMIGSGIAGGDWKHIEETINEVTPSLIITLVEYQP